MDYEQTIRDKWNGHGPPKFCLSRNAGGRQTGQIMTSFFGAFFEISSNFLIEKVKL
jgi:hypothetical protein